MSHLFRFGYVLIVSLGFSFSLFSAEEEFPHHPDHYLVPSYHHVKKELDQIFEKHNALKNAKWLSRAGFKTLFFRSRGSLRIAYLPQLPGYLFKLYTDNVAGPGSNKYKRLIRRAAMATEVRRLIQHHNMKHFVVPDKWLYEVPYHAKNHDPTAGKRFILVVKDMELVSRKKSEKAWKKQMNPEALRELYSILAYGYTSLAVTQNLPYTKQGKFACIDTEYERRQFKLKRVKKFLSSKMRKEWVKILKQHRS